MKPKELILNPYFIVGLIVLLLNDFYLKYEFGNFITGKLSDFAGLLIFPMFVATIIPQLRKSIPLITGIGFILWKLPIITPLIDLVNQIPYVHIQRVIDYSDYMALPILLLSYYLINYGEYNTRLKWKTTTIVSKFAFLSIAFFAFCATSHVPAYEVPQGTIFIDKSYTIKLPKDSVINTIRQLGYNCDFHHPDTLLTRIGRIYPLDYYQTDNIMLANDIMNQSDTVLNVKYLLTEIKPNKTKLTIISVALSEEGSIQNWKRLKRLSKEYKSLLKNGFIKKIE
ncbi:MAG: hypothetical protein LBQ60_13430 [Bacteroidales bacterium]|nr:hypothetical protein [Bacteroidales bacterium]